MKIVMASHYFSSHKGGVEIVADALFGALADSEREIVWMAGDVSSPPQSTRRARAVSLPIFNFVENKTGLPLPIPTPGAMGRILSEIKTSDLLLLHDCLYLTNIFAFLVAKLYRIPVLIIQHTRYFPTSSRLLNAVLRFATATVTHPMLKRAAQVVYIGKTTMESYERVRYKRRPQLIYNGVNTDLFHKIQEPETLPELRSKYNLPEKSTVILFVGRFIEKKGLLAIKHMAAQRPEWNWVLAGWGPLNPNKWHAENVQVFSGLDDAAIAELYRCSDLFVLPSRGEGGFALVVREALTSGIPVVCGDEMLGADPSMAGLVRGAQVSMDDDERTAAEFLIAIDESLAQHEMLKENSQERESYVETHYSWHQAIDRYDEIIYRLVGIEVVKSNERVMTAG